MYFEFGRNLQAGLDCAGEISPGHGAIFGWVRHSPGTALDVRVETGTGASSETLVLDLHPRHDVEAPGGLTVTGFSLIHTLPAAPSERLLIIHTDEGVPGTNEEVAVDLLAYDLPADVRGATLNRDWGANYRLLHASAAPAGGRGGGAGGTAIFGEWLDRLPRCVGSADWFMDFRAVQAVVLPNGELAISGALNLPGAPEGPLDAKACALVRHPDGRFDLLPVGGTSGAALEGAFVLRGHVAAPPGLPVEVVVQVRRGGQAWWVRAEAASASLAGLLNALSMPTVELTAADANALQGWMREVLSQRSRALKDYLSGLGLAAGLAQPGGTALLFDVNDEYAARVLALLAPQLESRFGRIVLSGSAAGRAAAALLRRGRLEVVTEDEAEGALAVAGRTGGSVSPIDTASLVEAAVGGDPSRLTAHALPADRLPMIGALHAVAGIGPMETTIRRLVAIMAGVDAAALPMPPQRPDAIGGLVAEHLHGLWEMLPMAGAGR